MRKFKSIALLFTAITLMGCDSEDPDLKYFDPGTLKQLAEQGDTQAQVMLAKNFLQGRGMPVNRVEAMKWYKRAANQEFDTATSKYWYVQSLYGLGVLYEFGRGPVAQDFVESARWYKKAAELGEPSSQHILGKMYAKGNGVPQDQMEAYVWYSVAAANPYWHEGKYRGSPNTHEWIEQNRDDIAETLSLTELNAAQARASKLHEEILPRTYEWRVEF